MNKLQVKSSTIKTVAYNYENGKLEIEFIRGVTYQYEEVPVHIVCCLLFLVPRFIMYIFLQFIQFLLIALLEKRF